MAAAAEESAREQARIAVAEIQAEMAMAACQVEAENPEMVVAASQVHGT
eukprot:SAG22_NODE_4992_length_1113_cov_7.702170_1_plen_49_part_00